LTTALQYLKHAARRARYAAPVRGQDAATLRRLQRSGRVVYGPHTYGIPKIMTYHLGIERAIFGNYSSINGTYLLGGQHGIDRVTTYPHRINWQMEGAGTDGFPRHGADTHVGSDVWTCENSLIMSGITIGDGAIIAAGAVATKDVPPYAIVGGNPATLIRYRFSEEQIEALLEIKWWNWSDADVREAVPLLSSPDVDAFIEHARAKFRTPPVDNQV